MSGLVFWRRLRCLETAGAAHRTMVTGLGTGLDGALLFLLEEINQLRHGSFFDTKLFLAGV